MTAIQVLTALHHGEGAAVAFARKADRWQECGAILAADLPAKWPSLAPELAQDSYFSLASTYEQKSTSRISELGLPLWSRKAERLRWLNAVVIDLDHHADKNFSAEALLERFCCELAAQSIPSPTFVSFSGRGLWAIWQLADHTDPTRPVQAFPEKRALAQRITHELVKRFVLLGADRNATDAARVMRVPDSVNSKATAENSHVRFFRASAATYTLPELAAALSVRARKVFLPGEKKAKSRTKAHAAALRWRYPLEGFYALWKICGGFGEGTRHSAIYICAVLLRKNRATPKHIFSECLRLAESSKPVLSAEDVRRSVAASEKATAYNFSNSKLGEMLKITQQEITALPQWFRLKVKKDKAAKIAERRAIISRELHEAGEWITTRQFVPLLLAKYGLHITQSTVMRDLKALSEPLSLLKDQNLSNCISKQNGSSQSTQSDESFPVPNKDAFVGSGRTDVALRVCKNGLPHANRAAKRTALIEKNAADCLSAALEENQWVAQELAVPRTVGKRAVPERRRGLMKGVAMNSAIDLWKHTCHKSI